MKSIPLKLTAWNLLAIVLLFTAGCASGPQGNRMQAVGPSPNEPSNGNGNGSLQVYSALDLAPVDYEMTTYAQRTGFPMENDSIKSTMLHTTSHSSYEIYSSNGALVKHVNNSKSGNNPNPEIVSLQPGSYLVEGDTEEYDSVSHPVIIPVRIKSGLTTTVHLDGKWNLASSGNSSDMVKFPNGHTVGWHDLESVEPLLGRNQKLYSHTLLNY